MTSVQHLSDFKAALFDVDGTLTNKSREITPRTLAALKLLQGAGIVTGMATGQTVARLKQKHLALFPQNAIHITAGGAQLLNGKGEILWEKLLPAAVTKRIYHEANDQDCPMVIQHDGTLYVNDGMREYIKINEHRYQGVTLKPLSELTEWSVANIILFTTESYVAQLKMNPDIQVKQFSDSMTYIDITAPGITKGTAAVRWSELTGIPLSQTMVFGDSDNDIEIFQEAGWSVALGNAIEPLKAIANRIIAHTDQDGLAIYLENIVKGDAL